MGLSTYIAQILITRTEEIISNYGPEAPLIVRSSVVAVPP